MLKALRNAFFTGLIILIPLSVTLFVINFLIVKIGTPSSRLFFFFVDPTLRQSGWIEIILSFISILAVVILITILGVISRYFFGRILLVFTERVLKSVPFIGPIYNTVKQIVDTFTQQSAAVFQKVVLVEYPRKGIYSIGFLTSTAQGEIQTKTDASVVNVFVPTTPNPTSGFLLILPKEDIIFLDMSASDGMKLVISGGAVVPGDLQKVAPKNNA